MFIADEHSHAYIKTNHVVQPHLDNGNNCQIVLVLASLYLTVDRSFHEYVD